MGSPGEQEEMELTEILLHSHFELSELNLSSDGLFVKKINILKVSKIPSFFLLSPPSILLSIYLATKPHPPNGLPHLSNGVPLLSNGVPHLSNRELPNNV